MSKSILPGAVAGQHQSGLRRAMRLAALAPVMVGSLALLTAGPAQSQVIEEPTTTTTEAPTTTTTEAPTTTTTAAPTTTTTVAVPVVVPAPVIGTITNGRQAFSLDWTAPALDPGATVFFYQVLAMQGDVVKAVQTVNGNVLSTSVAGLTNGADYTVIVNALTSQGWFTSVAKPAKPVADAVDAVKSLLVGNLAVVTGNTTATASWDAPSFDGGQPIVAYVVNAVNNSTGDLLSWRTVGPDVRSASLVGFAKGIAYDVNVFAVTSKGFGTVSSREIIGSNTGANPIAPAVTQGSAYVNGAGDIVASWFPAVEKGVPAFNYSIVLMQDGVMKAWSIVGADGRSGAVSNYDPTKAADVYILPGSVIGFGTPKMITLPAVPAVPAAT